MPRIGIAKGEKLKPCPFCGGKATRWRWKYGGEWTIECSMCQARTRKHIGEDVAIASWNQRVKIEEE